MRQTIAEIIEATKGGIRTWHDSVTEPGNYTDEELLSRYVQFHRGRPSAIISFTDRKIRGGANVVVEPDGTVKTEVHQDVISEAVRYEQKMEELLARRQDAKR